MGDTISAPVVPDLQLMFEKLQTLHPLLPAGLSLLAVLAGAFIVNLIARHLLVRWVRSFAKQSSVTWDDALVSHHVFRRLAQVLPALIIFIGVPFIPDMPESGAQLIRNIAMGYMVLVLTLTLSAILGAANTIYAASPVAKHRPLKGFVQLAQIAVWIIGGGVDRRFCAGALASAVT